MGAYFSDYQKFYFEEQSSKKGMDYDYLWCAYDTNQHRHMDFYELTFVSSGNPKHYYRGEQKELKKKSMFFFKPGEIHRLYTEPFESIHFTFFAKPSFFERFFEEHPIVEHVLGEKKFIECEMTDAEYEYMSMLANHLTHAEEEYVSICSLLYNAFSILRMHNSATYKTASKGNKYVIDLIEKMNNTIYLDKKIQDIYQEYPIARCTLIKEFKEYTGLTIAQYQKKQKLAYATQLLNTSDCQITNVAMVLGFDSLSHFIRIFKEEYGMSPTEYRKAHRPK